jgi:hypothetical protein
MFKFPKGLFHFLTLFFLVSCKTIQPEAPSIVSSNIPAMPAAVSSIVNVPVTVDLKNYFKKAEEMVPVENKGSDNPCEGVRYQYVFNRNPLQFSGNGMSLNLDVDGEYSVSGSYCVKCVYGACVAKTPSFSCGIGEPMRKIKVGYTSTLSVTPGYQVNSNTKLAYIKPLDPCQISFLKYDITDNLIENIKGPLNDLGKTIDQQTATYPLKNYVQDFWNKLFEEQQAGDFGFLNLHPTGLEMTGMHMQGTTLKFLLGISCKPQFTLRSMAQKPGLVPKMTTLAKDSGFHIMMDLHAAYEDITKQAATALSGKIIELKNRKFIIDDVELQGAGNAKMVVKVKFSGNKKGLLYLVGTPKIDVIKNTLSIPDLSFDIHSKNILIKLANWLLDDKITEKIKASCVYDLTPQLNIAKDRLQKELNRDITSDIQMKASVNHFKVINIFPAEKELFLRVFTNGNILVNMK